MSPRSFAQVPGLLSSLYQLQSYVSTQQLAVPLVAAFSGRASCATPLPRFGLGAATLSALRHHSSAATSSNSGRPKGWEQLQKDGHVVNPCKSPHHPAVLAGVLPTPDGEELSVQEAYNPESSCFGCGPSSPDGLHLKSRRMPGEGLGRLEARVTIPSRYCAFPGIVNGGILSTVMDCHGNWAAAVCLMDKGCLPRPPLTLTASMSVMFKEPTPPNTELILRSRVLSLRESTTASGSGGSGSSSGSGAYGSGGGAYGSGGSGSKMAQAQAQKATVEVEVVVLQPLDAATAAAAAPPSSAVGPVPGAETAALGAAATAAAAGGFTPGQGAAEPPMKILAVGRGVFKRLGALRAL